MKSVVPKAIELALKLTDRGYKKVIEEIIFIFY